MDLGSLPKTRKIGNRECSLTVLGDENLGWSVSYMYYDYDPLNMDFYRDLQDAIDALTQKLGIKAEEITEEWLEKNGYQHETINETLHQWVSRDKRVVIGKYSNTQGRDWNVHIDNECFQSIGSLDIQEIWQLNSILRLTGIKRES